MSATPADTLFRPPQLPQRPQRDHTARVRPERGRCPLLTLALLALACVSIGLSASGTRLRAQAPTPGGGPGGAGIDRIRLTNIGVAGGVVKPVSVEGASLVSVHADYGEVLPRWRLVFSASYWNSRYTDATVRRFADSLLAIVEDPAGDATVWVGPVRVSAVSVAAEGRWSPRSGRQRFRPYVGGGLGVYALNAEGRGISGTFVEDALDTITTGLAVVAGGDLLLFPNLSIGMQARYDLLSGSRFGSLRAGASYVFRSQTGA